MWCACMAKSAWLRLFGEEVDFCGSCSLNLLWVEILPSQNESKVAKSGMWEQNKKKR